MRASRERAKSMLDAGLYCITAEAYSNGRNNIEVVEAMLDAGVRLIQYREKEKEMGEKYAQCVEIRRLTRNAGAGFIVNDHADLAMMVDADGIHVGQEDLPVEALRRLVGEEMVIGLSTHSPAQATAAGLTFRALGP